MVGRGVDGLGAGGACGGLTARSGGTVSCRPRCIVRHERLDNCVVRGANGKLSVRGEDSNPYQTRKGRFNGTSEGAGLPDRLAIGRRYAQEEV